MVGVFVLVGVLVAVGKGVRVDVIVGDGVDVRVGVAVQVGEDVAVGVGGSPTTVKRPDTSHLVPTNNWTSYSPGFHSDEEGSQSEYPYPPVPPSQGLVS